MREAWLEQRPAAAEPYDGFFLAQPSNARLNTVADYHGQLPAFAELFAAAGRDFDAFHGEVAKLAEMAAEDRMAALDELAQQAACVRPTSGWLSEVAEGVVKARAAHAVADSMCPRSPVPNAVQDSSR